MHIENLMQQFEKIREQLNILSELHGVDHPEVLKISKQLDDLHLQILKAQKNKKR